jgi:hypothetical protein
MDKWIDFYEPFFESRAKAEAFVELYEALQRGDPKHPAKIMMHQAQRLISISDVLREIRPGKDPLQLLFLLICAENIAKLHDNFKDEGKSRHYVRQFFDRFLTDAEKARLQSGFSRPDWTPLKFKEVVDLLYAIRCDVVHEGEYWGFHFQDGRHPLINCEQNVIANIQLCELKELVVRGCIEAIRTYGQEEVSHATTD